ncbi:MAG: hypothetical protein AAFW73_21285 [Bacteroidota bacterium]
MSRLEQLQHFLVQLQGSIGTALKIALRSRWRVRLPGAAEELVIVMGNGPSLKTDLAEYGAALQSKSTFAVNYFVNTAHYTVVRPNFYLLAAPEFWLPEVTDRQREFREDTFRNLATKTEWDVQLFIPFAGLQHSYLQDRLATLPASITIVPFNPTPVEGLRSFDFFCFRQHWGMPRPHNVLIPATMLSIGMGFRTIGLIGVDHSWLPEISVTEDNVALLHQKHFYDEKTSKHRPMPSLKRRPRRLYEILEKFMLAFRAYHTIDDYSRQRGSRIYNATKGSFIDAFERRSLSDLLAPRKVKTHE